jgi:NTP pyrophosphatase (non-canonical NTP hydrolase)
MHFYEYQTLAARTMNKLEERDALSLTALGLGGEAGEVLDLIKKHLYHGHALDRDKIIKELGDVLWYASQMAAAIGASFDEVAERNIDKLKARYPDGFSEKASQERTE